MSGVRQSPLTSEGWTRHQEEVVKPPLTGADGWSGMEPLLKIAFGNASAIPTTPSAPLPWLRIFFLMAQPSLLYPYREEKLSASHFLTASVTAHIFWIPGNTCGHRPCLLRSISMFCNTLGKPEWNVSVHRFRNCVSQESPEITINPFSFLGRRLDSFTQAKPGPVSDQARSTRRWVLDCRNTAGSPGIRETDTERSPAPFCRQWYPDA